LVQLLQLECDASERECVQRSMARRRNDEEVGVGLLGQFRELVGGITEIDIKIRPYAAPSQRADDMVVENLP
jgi:hypothetical protein